MTYLTEEEAKTQMCPHVRYCINEDVMQEGRSPLYVHQLCQGSDCKMAWRWGPIWRSGFAAAPGPNVALGYCGIAGKPK